MTSTLPRPIYRAKPLSDVEQEAERARLPWRAHHLAKKYSVSLPLANVVVGLLFDFEARQ